MIWLILLVLYIPYVTATQWFVRCVTKEILRSIKEAGEDLLTLDKDGRDYKKFKEKIGLDDSTETEFEKKIREEVWSLEILGRKRVSLSWLTQLIGLLEQLLFIAAIIFLFSNSSSNGGAKEIVTLFGGWFGIKVLGNYAQWSSVFLGRASFYSFFLGTFLNVTFAILFGACSVRILDLYGAL